MPGQHAAQKATEKTKGLPRCHDYLARPPKIQNQITPFQGPDMGGHITKFKRVLNE